MVDVHEEDEVCEGCGESLADKETHVDFSGNVLCEKCYQLCDDDDEEFEDEDDEG